MRVVLLNPIWSYTRTTPPYNLAELAAFTRQKGYNNIEILDLNYELFKVIDPEIKFQKALNLVVEKRPDIIGITCHTIHVPFCVKFTRMLKERLDVPIILGGIHATFKTEELFKTCRIDYIIRGEGELTFVELLDYLSSRFKHPKKLNNILGLSYKDNEIIKHNPDRPLIKDISKLPFPAFDLLKVLNKPNIKKLSPVHNYFYRPLNTYIEASIVASRGCPFKCRFCSANRMWKYQRRKNVNRVLKEIDYLLDKLNTNYVKFDDDCFLLNKPWALSIMKHLKKRNINWGCLARIDQIDAEILDAMQKSGCVDIYHGIETGSEKMRRVLNKKYRLNTTNKFIINTVKKEIGRNISPVCSFMVGIPGETEKDFWKTISLAKKVKDIGATIQLWIMTPYPDTPAANMFNKYLRKMDRWDILRQADIFSDEQLILYESVLKEFDNDNPDNLIYSASTNLRKFVINYERARNLLGLNTVTKRGCFLYNYLSYRDKHIKFVDFTKKTNIVMLSELNTNGQHVLIKLIPPNVNWQELIGKLEQFQPKTCIISIGELDKNNIEHFKNNFHNLLKFVVEKDIKFTISKPLPYYLHNLEIDNLLKYARYYPGSCEDCLELFKYEDGRLILCGGKIIGKRNVFNGRKQIFHFFMESIGSKESFRMNHSCFSKPLGCRRKKLSPALCYKLSPKILVAKRTNRKDTSTFINSIMNGNENNNRFKLVKFIDIDKLSKATIARYKNDQFIIFNLDSEEICSATYEFVALLNKFNGRNTLWSIINGIPSTQVKGWLNLFNHLAANEIINLIYNNEIKSIL